MALSEEQACKSLGTLIESYHEVVHSGHIDLASESDVLVFIERLFRDVLGWPTEDITKFQREKPVAGRKRADRILNLGSGDTIFIEAKRFGAIERLSDEWAIGPHQLALPGMATDRTQEEQQAINYAFQNDGTWAILTNFEILRLFNARRDWLVLSFETPGAYQADFELLRQLSWENLNSGSLDALNSQRWTKEVDTDYLQFINEQREQLAIDITLNRNRNTWAYTEDGDLRVGLLREVVQRFLDRLVIVRFAEDHYVIPQGTLRRFHELRMANSSYTQELQFYLRDFFSRFDQEHNSALFARGEVDEAHFSDDVLLPLISKLYEARYRAMPPDVMGNTYEQYLGKTLVADNGSVETRDNLETRKKQGSYYTPQYIVQFIVDQTLGRYLYATYDGKPGGIAIPNGKRKASQEIRELRLLDSACGSGSFLIYAFQVLAEFYQAEVTRLTEVHLQMVRNMARNFADVPLDSRIEAQRVEDERDFLRDNYRNLILEQHLYGIDLDPQAAEIAVVNLMMRAMERKGRSKRLPLLLNQNIKVGNSLLGLRPDDSLLEDHFESLAAIRRLRAELIETFHLEPRHSEIIAELESTTGELYRHYQTEFTENFHEIDNVRPFHWAVEFPEVFVNENGHISENSGFDFIFGNPPYGAKLSEREKHYFRRTFNIGTTNTAPLFMMRSLDLLRKGGVHGLIIPKSFLFASDWVTARGRFLDGLRTLVDCRKVWDDVKLEQVIYIHEHGSVIPKYQNLKRDDHVFNLVDHVEKEECRRFAFLLNDLEARELQIAHLMLEPEEMLGFHIKNTRGIGLQGELSEIREGRTVIGGNNVQRYHLRSNRGFTSTETYTQNAVAISSNILVQNIVAHIVNPVPHIKIIAHLLQASESDMLILDTVNQVEIKSESLTSHFVLALLNSKLMNWYVYRFIFAKAIRTMHFDNPVTDRIPLPRLDGQSEIVRRISEEVERIYENRHANVITSQERIDQCIYELYGLSADQIALVKANMP